MPGRSSACEETRFDQTSCRVGGNSRRNACNDHGSLLFCIQLAHCLPPLEHRPRGYTSRYLYCRKGCKYLLGNCENIKTCQFLPQIESETLGENAAWQVCSMRRGGASGTLVTKRK